MILLSLYSLLFIGLTSYVNSQGVITCGGFIQSDFPIDFGRVMVKLVTPEGNLKYETDVAPNNGYYMIPVYNKGEYDIQVNPPEGWTFEPAKERILLDGESDKCSKGIDINFIMKGFNVAAKVGAGPAGLSVQLFDSKSKSLINQVKSGEDGSVKFTGVAPGFYGLKLDESNEMCISATAVTFEVKSDSLTVENGIKILGYKVKGQVLENNQGIADVTLLIYAKKGTKISECSPKQISSMPNSKDGLEFVCSVKSSSAGSFQFPCVPQGNNYLIVPYFESNGVRFTVSPSSLKVEVKQGAVVIKEPFTVRGFSVAGRVVWGSKTKGVADAKISVNGVEKTKTDDEGRFSLEEITSGNYEIQVAAKNAQFDLVKVELNAKNNKLADIAPKKLSVCGQVKLGHLPSHLPKLSKRTVVFSSSNKGIKSVTVHTDETSHFCHMVDNGVYDLEPQLTPMEKEAGVRLVPSSKKVTVENEPILNVLFSQFHASIGGQIKCIAPCKNIKVTLKSDGIEMVKTFDSSKQMHEYKFEQILPGKYSVQIESPDLCWNEARKLVTVDKSDISDIHFEHSGFIVNVQSTNDVNLDWTFSESKVVNGNQKIRKGNNEFCLPVNGEYVMKLSSCHEFEKAEYKYNTAQPNVIQFTAIKHKVNGVVKAKGNPAQVIISVESQTIGMKDLTNLKFAKDEAVFEFMANGQESVIITPKSDTYLFTPESKEIRVEDDCILKPVEFLGEKGIFVEGLTDPPIENVNVQMEKGDVKYSAVTDKTGKYIIGPLRTLNGFEFSAEKVGYTFVASDKKVGMFAAFKLSELVIKTESENGEGIAEVLISLSGVANYRSNNMTQHHGKITFVGLAPGEYFMKPVLKEYSFLPASRMVTVQEGSTNNVILKGNRVAFSVKGQVRHLGGQPAVGAVVEAVTPDSNQVHEESTCDEFGKFVVKGLIPGCNYELKLFQHPTISSTLPSVYKFKMEAHDLLEKDLIARPSINSMSLAGRIMTLPEYMPTLKVVVCRFDEPDAVAYSYPMNIGEMYYINGIPLDNTQYVIRLTTSLSASKYESFNLPEYQFTANKSFFLKEFNFEPKKRAMEADISKASYIALPLFILIVALIYNQNKIIPMVQNVKWRTSNESSVQESSFTQWTESHLSSDSAVKKRVKPRKT